MGAEPLLRQILADDAVTRRLGDPEARILIEWLVERVEELVATVSASAAQAEVGRLQRQARAIGCFVALWCHDQDHAGAVQFAAVQRFSWPLPPQGVDPCELMIDILEWESRRGTAKCAA